MHRVPLKVVQELMGHATIEVTMRYAHLSPGMKQSAVQLLDEPHSALGGPAETGARHITPFGQK